MSDNHDFAQGPSSPPNDPTTTARPPRPHLNTLTSPNQDGSDRNASTASLPGSRRGVRLENLEEEAVDTSAPAARPVQQQPGPIRRQSPAEPPHHHRFNHPSLRHRSQTVQFTERSNPLTSPISPTSSGLRHAGTDIFPTISQQGRRGSTMSASGASVYGRPKRSDTVRTYHRPTEVNWEPGAEPGIDTSEEADDGSLHHVHQVGTSTVM